jgi:preprotein translocase subunit SecE
MASVAEQNAMTTAIKSWPERVKTFYGDVRTEMKKVTAPSLKEVQATTLVVVVTVTLFAIYFWIIDNAIGSAIERLFRYFTHH